ncbi:MAG: chorismate mutase [Deltaproteobacteria bacterium]|nr:chorismate mutase [Deltaproteobacteria bacterium]
MSIKPILYQGKFDLPQIAAVLEGLEETIIFMLINRAQFAANQVAYDPDRSGFEGGKGMSLFTLRLRYHEEMDAVFGRFCVPEERPFTRDLPNPKRRVTLPETGLFLPNYNSINLAEEIIDAYMNLIPCICPEGDDGQYGSSVEHDVMALQAIARRIHFGALYVAESKYQSDKIHYRTMIESEDRAGLLVALTRAAVEERILKRVADKVEHIQAEINPEVRRRIPSEAIMAFYRNHIIPLTKEGQVRYFLNRQREDTSN